MTTLAERNRQVLCTSKREGVGTKVKQLLIRTTVKLDSFFSKLGKYSPQYISSDEILEELFMSNNMSSDKVPLGSQIEQSSPKETRTDNEASVSGISAEQPQKNDDLNFDELWEKQHAEWLTPLPEYQTLHGRLQLQKRMHEGDIKHIVSPKDHWIVYQTLVVQSSALKRAISLSNVIEILHSGWVADKTWERGVTSAVSAPLPINLL